MRKFIGVLCIATACAIVLTGCKIKISTNGDGNKGANVSVDENGVHVNAGGTSVDLDTPLVSIETDFKERVSDKVELPDLPAKDISKFAAHTEMGDLRIKKAASSSIKATLEYSVSGKDETVCKEISNLIGADLVSKDGQATCTALFDGKDKVSESVRDKYGSSYVVSLSFVIEIPENVSELKLDTSMGDIHVDDFTGKIDAETSMGDIKTNAVFDGDSTLETSMGNIDVDIDKVSDNKTLLKLETSMGDIDVSVKDSSRIKTSSVDDNFCSNELDAVIADKLTIDGHTSMGDISIR